MVESTFLTNKLLISQTAPEVLLTDFKLEWGKVSQTKGTHKQGSTELMKNDTL